MSLTTLNRFDEATASAILAEAILSGSGPGGPSLRAEQYASEINDLLNEVRQQLSIKTDDQSAEATGRIEHRLTREIRDILMSGVQSQSLVEELGSEGRLPLSAYKTVFSPGVLKDFGESAKTVSAAMRSPDEVQHFTGSGTLGPFVKGATLLTKWVSSSAGEAHWLLIVAQRSGEELSVESVWRVSPTRLDLSGAKTPLEMLEVFVQHYGWDFTVPSLLGTHRFILDTEVIGNPREYPRKLVNPSGQIKLFEIGYAGHATNKITGETHSHDTRIVIAYAVDLKAYLSEKPRA